MTGIIETKVYNGTPNFVGVTLINLSNGSTVVVPREEIVDVVRRMLTIYGNTKESKCLLDNRIGRMYCPECSHILNDDDLITDEHDNTNCPNCKRVTLMRRLVKEDL